MEASSGDIETNTLKKPLLIIKRGSIFKHNSPLLLKTAIKRPITDVGSAVQIDNPNSKKTCLASDVQSTSQDVSIKKEKKAEIIISANTNNATDQLPSNATSSLQKSAILETTGKTKVPKIGSKTKKNKSYHILKTKCEKHGTLPTHQAEGLVEVGDVFNSLEEFTDYAAGHAQQWFFYYLRFQSRNMKTSSRYNSKKPMFCLYQCRFGKKRYKSQSKGIRKTRPLATVECPASVTLICDPDTDYFVVRDVCHHHSHDLSAEMFSQQPHGYRLPQHIKEEIRDLARFNVDSGLVRQYVESKKPGLKLNKTIYNQFKKVRGQGSKDNMSAERIKEMIEKIRYIKANFDPVLKGPTPKIDKKPKKGLRPKDVKEPRKSSSSKVSNKPRGKPPKNVCQSYNDVSVAKINNDCLSDIPCDQKLIQSIEQQKLACETQLNPWEEASSNDSDSGSDNVKSETEYEISTEAGTNDATEDYDDSNEQYIIENPETIILDTQMPIVEPETGISDEQIRIINPTTGILDELLIVVPESGISDERIRIVNPTTGIVDDQMLIVETETAISDERTRMVNPTTGILDEQMSLGEPELVPSDQETVQSTNMSVKAYKIGDLTIETVETVDDAGIATVVLHQIKSTKDLTERHLIDELSKVERYITEPNPEPIKSYPKNTEASGAPAAVPEALISGKKNKVNQAETLKARALTNSHLRCQMRHSEMPEYRAEGLIKVKDTFSSMEQFSRYSAAHALKWFFYYYVNDSRNVKTSIRYNSKKTTWYNFSCRFNKGRYVSQSTGARKIKPKTIQCPATVSMQCKPGEDLFTVTYVCHHHTHELSLKMFSQEPHGHRLSPEWKDEIRELAWFQLDVKLIRQYLNAKTGFDLTKTIKNVICKMRRERQKINVSPEKEKEILEKIEDIKQKFFIPKRASPGSKDAKHTPQDTKEPSESDDEGNKSRVEARLNNILYDQKLIQSVKELQETTGCEIQINTLGDLNVIEKGISDVQAGLIEDTGLNDLQHANDVNDNDSQIEVDQELYSMDDNVRYIIPSDLDGTNILGVKDYVDKTAVECDEKVMKSKEEIEFIEDVNNISEEDNTVDSCNVQYEVPSVDYEINIDEAGTSQPDEKIYKDEYTEEENTESPKCYQNAAFEYRDSQNEYQTMYQYTDDDEDSNVKKESSEHLNYVQQYSKETYNSRDIGVQADLEIIELERDNEKIQKIESTILSKDLEKCAHSCSSRGRPKSYLEEGIINRFNIELYIGLHSITPCLENLAISMGLSVLHLLKKLYQGKAVFKMSLGRSGKLNRKTVQLSYVPLNIAFPFEKFKYMNALQEYKTMCSKYSNVVIKLETTVENMSNELNATKIKLENAESQNQQLLNKVESHQNLLNTQTLTEQVLKKCQEDLAEARAANNASSLKNKIDLQLAREQNEVLLKKIKDLEDLQLSSRLKDAEILKQVLQPTFERYKSNKARIENKFLRERIKELEEKSPVNIRLTEKIKVLEQTIEISDADTKRHKEKIKKLEELYLSDSQHLLDKIRMLEDELSALKTELSYTKKTENPSTNIIRFTDSENRRLLKEVKDLKKHKSSDNKILNEKIKRLNDAVSSLKKRLNEQKKKK